MKFNLPKTVKIGGTLYKVIERPEAHKDRLGQISYNSQTIAVDPEANQIDVFLHEIVHGVVRFLNADDLKEEWTDRIALCLRMMLTDNAGLFRSLLTALEKQFRKKK